MLAEKFSPLRASSTTSGLRASRLHGPRREIPILLNQPVRPGDSDNPARVCLSAGARVGVDEFERRFGPAA